MKKIVFPGETIATSEEVQPAGGTFEEDGLVHATVVGEPSLESRKALVANAKTPRLLKGGDLISGKVEDLFDQIALISFVPAEPGVVSSADRAFLRIAEIQGRGRFTESFQDFLRIGDVIKARVIEVTPLGVYLTIAEKGLGVLRAYCSVCRSELDGNLYCKDCSRQERRKIA